MPATPTKIDWSGVFTAIAPLAAAGGAALVQQLVPSDTKIGADAQAIFNDAFRLVADIIAAKSASPVVGPKLPA